MQFLESGREGRGDGWGQGGHRSGAPGLWLQDRPGCLGLGVQGGREGTRPQQELVPCELCNPSKKETGRRQNPSCEPTAATAIGCSFQRSQWEEGGKPWSCLEQQLLHFLGGPPRSPSSPLLKAKSWLDSKAPCTWETDRGLHFAKSKGRSREEEAALCPASLSESPAQAP